MNNHGGPLLAVRDSLRVIDCRACGWAHLDPLPAVDDAYYRDTFWSEKGAGWLARYVSERDWLDMRNRDWLSVIEEHTDGRALLDVGSGYGFFMYQAGASGWKPYGIEPSIEAAAYSKEHVFAPIYNGGWRDSTMLFDCNAITAFWLLEHLPDPRAFLAWARAHLALGGVLALCVPQEWTVLQAQANKRAAVRNYWLHPTHLNYFSSATLHNLLGRAGFRIVDALASFPIEFALGEGSDYTRDEKVGDRVHAQIRKGELNLLPKERIETYRMRARLCTGRDLLVICKVDA